MTKNLAFGTKLAPTLTQDPWVESRTRDTGGERTKRLTIDVPLEPACAPLMSDGVTPFALTQGACAPFQPFFDPLSKFLAEHDGEDGEQTIKSILEREAIRQITGDDKTLIWALRISTEA